MGFGVGGGIRIFHHSGIQEPSGKRMAPNTRIWQYLDCELTLNCPSEFIRDFPKSRVVFRAVEASMKITVVLLLACAIATAQNKPKADPPAVTAKAEAPVTTEIKPMTLLHPAAALKGVTNIYLEPMANDLDQYIKAELSKQLSGRIVVVLKPEDADAVLTGTGEWHKGTAQAITGRWLGLHDTATGAISLVTMDKALWSSEAGDRSIWWGVLARGGQRKVATRLVHNLKSALEHAK
jgi:hypothetical protein